MNLYFRLIFLLMRSLFFKKTDLTASISTWVRVGFFDCDVHFHLNNARYWSFMDLGRFQHILQTGLLPHLFKNRTYPVLQAAEINFFKEISIGTLLRIETDVIDTDDKYLYIDQKVFDGDTLCAHARLRGLFRNKNGNISTETLFNWVDQPIKKKDPLCASLELWKEYMRLKREENTLSK